jgi:hypothetical protein
MPKHWTELEDFERALNFMWALEGGGQDVPLAAFRRVTGWPTDRVAAAFSKCVEMEGHKQYGRIGNAVERGLKLAPNTTQHEGLK